VPTKFRAFPRGWYLSSQYAWWQYCTLRILMPFSPFGRTYFCICDSCSYSENCFSISLDHFAYSPWTFDFSTCLRYGPKDWHPLEDLTPEHLPQGIVWRFLDFICCTLRMNHTWRMSASHWYEAGISIWVSIATKKWHYQRWHQQSCQVSAFANVLLCRSPLMNFPPLSLAALYKINIDFPMV